MPPGCSQLAGLVQRCQREQSGLFTAVVDTCGDLQTKLAACLAAPPELIVATEDEDAVRQFGEYGPGTRHICPLRATHSH